MCTTIVFWRNIFTLETTIYTVIVCLQVTNEGLISGLRVLKTILAKWVFTSVLLSSI